jgi:metallo-beta-lactamase class B
MRFLLAIFLLVAAAAKANYYPTSADIGKIVYQSKDLTITQVAPNTYVHTSFLNTQSFGRVACNGMIVRNGAEAVVFDTPTSIIESEELIRWISNTLRCKVNAVVSTHFHEDCVGGLPEFTRNKIPSYANEKTLTFAKQRKFNVPQHCFANSLTLNVGSAKVYATFFGEGHTKDNIAGYFPADEVLFGGCLIKEVNAAKGNLADANVQAWSATVTNLKKAYPNLKVVIPGHGKTGDTSLLDYTIQLFQQQ